MEPDDLSLEALPRMQYHRFEAWAISPNACARCAHLPQAHPLWCDACDRPAFQHDPEGSVCAQGG